MSSESLGRVVAIRIYDEHRAPLVGARLEFGLGDTDERIRVPSSEGHAQIVLPGNNQDVLTVRATYGSETQTFRLGPKASSLMIEFHTGQARGGGSRELDTESTPDPGPAHVERPEISAYQRPSRPTREAPASILLCTANSIRPHDYLGLLEDEHKAIIEGLRAADHGASYQLAQCPAATWADVVNEVSQRMPEVLHFSGHGDPSGSLVLRGATLDERQPIPPARLAQLLARLKKRPFLVTFATCHSRVLAELAADHAAFAIGFDGPLEDRSARVFSKALYTKLASRTPPDVPLAFDLAQLTCEGEGHRSVKRAQLFAHPRTSEGGDDDPQTEPPSIDDQTLVKTLASLFHDSGNATLLTRSVGFDPGETPSFETPSIFWDWVIREARKGTVVDVRTVVKAALARYPFNEFLKKYLADRG